MNGSRRIILVAGLVLLVGAPFAGSLLRGLPAAFFEFPPITRYIVHAPFSWPIFIVFALLGLLAAAMTIRPTWFGFGRISAATTSAQPSSPNSGQRDRRSETAATPFPVWGWLGLALNLASWICGWGRFDWLGVMKDHCFFPLWFGYILVMDGLVHCRTRSSILARSPRTFIVLFPASAAAWWYFEFLNRFVQNWWYDGTATYSALHYGVFATLCFSTVLPAVLETAEWLASFSWFESNYVNGPRWPALAGWTAVVAGALALAWMAVWPCPLFFVTWIAPLIVLAGSLRAAGLDTPFSELRHGDGRRLAVLAVAALICGLFWEMWNFWSLPKWHYSIPYAGRFRVFEMPIVGYAGYLPFGPICWCFWAVIEGVLGAAPKTTAILPLRPPAARPDQPA